MSHDPKHHHREPDLNKVLDKVEQMMKEGTMEMLPMVQQPTVSSDIVRIATEGGRPGRF